MSMLPVPLDTSVVAAAGALSYHAAMDADCIAGNIAEVWERVRVAAEKVGRDPETVQVLAVSKTHPAEAVRAAFAAGQRHFGENYLQEAEDKISATGDLDGIHWHFIGPIQSNKTRAIAAHFDWVHSLDRLKIARLSEIQAGRLSAGQRRRASLANLLLSDARLWLMDEPLTNLDVAGKALVKELISEHVTGGGVCVLVAHEVVEVERVHLAQLELGRKS